MKKEREERDKEREGKRVDSEIERKWKRKVQRGSEKKRGVIERKR